LPFVDFTADDAASRGLRVADRGSDCIFERSGLAMKRRVGLAAVLSGRVVVGSGCVERVGGREQIVPGPISSSTTTVPFLPNPERLPSGEAVTVPADAAALMQAVAWQTSETWRKKTRAWYLNPRAR
jgi:hypothetical protein